ncbi:MAG: DEAD/DEAH box helicase family protein [Myxococcales bacterium]|nr:DEAD/DEAH box helicase family protein [Myxococcales bacterium]
MGDVFGFLQAEWPEIHEAADAAFPEPRTACFYARRALELADVGLPPRPQPQPHRPVERHYQTRAVRRVAEAFERDNERKALLVMATGAGKTRTVIALRSYIEDFYIPERMH